MNRWQSEKEYLKQARLFYIQEASYQFHQYVWHQNEQTQKIGLKSGILVAKSVD